MTNSEASNRQQAQNPASLPSSIDASPEPAPVDLAPLNGPLAANLGDGAIGRLNAGDRADVIAAIDCDYHAPSYGECAACGDRVERTIEAFERIVREHTERALAEVEQRIEAWIRHGEAVPADVTTYDRWIVHEELRAIVLAARQDQDR